MKVKNRLRVQALEDALSMADTVVVVTEDDDYDKWGKAIAPRVAVLHEDARRVRVLVPAAFRGGDPFDATGATVIVDKLDGYDILPALAAAAKVIFLTPPPADPEQVAARLARTHMRVVPTYVPDPLGIYADGQTAQFAVSRRLRERCYAGFAEGPDVMAKEAVAALEDAGWTLTPPAADAG